MAEYDGESALGRWSRRKMDRKQAAPETVADEREADATETRSEPESNGAVVESPQPDEAPLPELPPIEELNADSDYKPFLQDGVPEQLRTLALRKLWRSNPIFANLDGLNDYDEDFSITSGKIVATAYRVGKGMIRDVLDDVDDKNDEAMVTRSPAPEDGCDGADLESIEDRPDTDLDNPDNPDIADGRPDRR